MGTLTSSHLRVSSPSDVFALLFKLFKLKLARPIKISKNTTANYNKSCTNHHIYFEICNPCTVCIKILCYNVLHIPNDSSEQMLHSESIQIRTCGGTNACMTSKSSLSWDTLYLCGRISLSHYGQNLPFLGYCLPR